MFDIFKKSPKRDVTSIKETVKELEDLEVRVLALQKNLQDLECAMQKAVTKVGIVRFNPFHNVGSDQSFSLALLNEQRNGFVLTSHYLHETQRVYAKPVKNGVSEYTLSEEEQQAIAKAMTND